MNNPNFSSTDTMKISALIITFNEEKHVKEAIENVFFANEIIIIDSYSTDRTVAIAQSYPEVKVIQRGFVNYADQRNFAISQAAFPWILFIDTDERITPALKNEILATVQSNPIANAFQFRRLFFYEKTPLRFSGWQTDKNYRLFKKANCHYNPSKIVHEKLIVEGESSILKNKLLHFSFQNFENYKLKMIQYGKMKAIEAFQKKTIPNGYHFYIRPTYQFLYQYFIRLGILDGKKGIIVCYLNAYSVYVRFQELKKLLNKN